MKATVAICVAVIAVFAAATIATAAVISYFPSPDYGGWKVTAQFCGGQR